MRSAGTPGFSTGPHGRSTRNTWNGSPQRELTTNPLSGKLGADQSALAGAARYLRGWYCPGLFWSPPSRPVKAPLNRIHGQAATSVPGRDSRAPPYPVPPIQFRREHMVTVGTTSHDASQARKGG